MRIQFKLKGQQPVDIGCVETIIYKDKIIDINSNGASSSLWAEDIEELKIYEY